MNEIHENVHLSIFILGCDICSLKRRVFLLRNELYLFPGYFIMCFDVAFSEDEAYQLYNFTHGYSCTLDGNI